MSRSVPAVPWLLVLRDRDLPPASARPVDEQPVAHRPEHPHPGAAHVLALRHGQSEWNAIGRWQGQADIPLSETGLAQAATAAVTLEAEAPRFDAVWASDLVRARRTAEIMAEVLGISAVTLDSRLRETHAGEWQGLIKTEIESGWPGYLDEGHRPPGFESYDAVSERMVSCLIDVATAHPASHVLVVCHTGIIRATRRRFGAPDFLLPNLGGSWFTVVPGEGAPVAPGGIVLPLDPRGAGVIE
jgi:broad specificity phosphatase PhoE